MVHPVLKELDVIRFPHATNFKVGAFEWSLLEQVIRGRSQSLADEVGTSVKYPEGAVKQVFVNAYERSGRARKDCIKHHGTVCVVCAFDFELYVLLTLKSFTAPWVKALFMCITFLICLWCSQAKG